MVEAERFALIIGMVALVTVVIFLGRRAVQPRSSSLLVQAMAARMSRVPASFAVKSADGNGVIDAVLLPGTGRGFFVEVVGESHYQDALRSCGADAGGDSELSVILGPEATNPVDANAVVVKTLQHATIGYLSRQDAKRYQPTLLELQRRGLVSICAAKLFGGLAEQKLIGVWLDLDEPTMVARFSERYRGRRT